MVFGLNGKSCKQDVDALSHERICELAGIPVGKAKVSFRDGPATKTATGLAANQSVKVTAGMLIDVEAGDG